MRKRRLILPVLAAVVSVLGLVVALNASASARATAKRATDPRTAWTPLGIAANQFDYNSSRPGLYRTSDGVLHVAYISKYSTTEGFKFRLWHLAISPRGQVLRKNTIVSGYGTLHPSPQLVAGPNGGIRAIFAGGTGVLNDFHYSGVFTAVSSDKTGASWTVPDERIGTQTLHEFQASTTADGTPVVVWTDSEIGSAGWLRWHVGLGTGPDQEIHFAIAPRSENVVRDGNHVYLTWVIRGPAASGGGVWVKQVLPSAGAAVRAPGSATSEGVFDPGRPVAIAARRGGGTWVAYCRGDDFDCTRILLWKLGTSTTYTLPHPGTASGTDQWISVNLSTAPSGRLWVAWRGYYGLTYALRTGTNGHTFGALRVINETGFDGCCQGKLDAEGSSGPLHMFRNDTDSGPNNRLISPGLSMSVTPTRWPEQTTKTVTFTVTDAGSAVAAATISAHGRSCHTSTAGKCQITFPAQGQASFPATATKPGYYRAVTTLRIT